MIILAIDTSCDETAAAVTSDNLVLSNIVWSQASEHAKFGGVVPNLAKRAHEERISWVVEQAIKRSGVERKKIGAVGVTIGPGLAIALEVGIRQAKNVAGFLNKPLVVVNHIEGHIFSAMARRPVKSGRGTADVNIRFPAWALVVSGGHTELIWVEAPGK